MLFRPHWYRSSTTRARLQRRPTIIAVAASEPQPQPETARAADVGLEAVPGRRLRLLFFVHSVNYDRHFEAVLRELLERGHLVHVACEIKKRGRGQGRLFESFQSAYSGFSYGRVPRRKSPVWVTVSRQLRVGIDYLRYLEPEFEGATRLRARAERRAGRAVPLLARLPLLCSPSGRHLLDAVLRVLDRATPIDRGVAKFVARFQPDAILVTPLVNFGSLQADYVRCARSLGVPSALLVASWDNLTNKGVIRDQPDLVLVWNEAQRREAIDLHGVPPERVLATGAHTYDHWFDWRPSATKAEFCERLGLDPERQVLLYVASSGDVAPDEAPFIARWIDFLRGSSRPELRDASVVVRPHPTNVRTWKQHDLTEPGRVVVFPPEGARPVQAEAKRDYFDSLYHAVAVVGLNTSALIEAGIVGRPVLSLVLDENREGQEDTLHFAHLAGEGGLLRVARRWDEHERQLVAALTSTDASDESFVGSFVRPRGLASPAAPLLVDAVEDLAGRIGRPVPRAGWRLPVRAAIAVFAFPLFWGKELHGRTAMFARSIRTRPPLARRAGGSRPEGEL
jgi:hypothetical protein